MGGGSRRTRWRGWGGRGSSNDDVIDDERLRPESGMEEHGDDFGANPIDSLHREGDLKVVELVDTVVCRDEADDRAGEGLCRACVLGWLTWTGRRRWPRRR